MKRVLAALVLVFMLAACGSGGPATNKIKIGVALYQGDDTFISIVLSEIIAAARERETADGVKITINYSDGAGNQSVQNVQVDNFITQGYSALCVNMVDRTAAGVIIDKAMSEDIPLVFFNREPVREDMERWEKTVYVGAKAEQSGVIQGGLVVQAFLENPELYDKNGDGVIQYVMLEGEQGHQDALLRTDSSIKALLDAGLKVEKLANESANWQRSQGKSKMLDWLKRFDNIEVVFSNNDDMALGAIDALTENGYNLPDGDGIMVVGIDATPAALAALENGSLYATVLNDAKAQARAIFELAYSMAVSGTPETRNEAFDGKYLLIDYAPVTKEVKSSED